MDSKKKKDTRGEFRQSGARRKEKREQGKLEIAACQNKKKREGAAKTRVALGLAGNIPKQTKEKSKKFCLSLKGGNREKGG